MQITAACVCVFARTKRNLQTSSNIAISEILNDARTLKPLNNNTRKSRFAVRIYSASRVSHEIALFLIYLTESFRNLAKRMYSSATQLLFSR